MRKRIKSNDQQPEFKTPHFAYKSDYQIAPPAQGENLQSKTYHQHFNQSQTHFKKYYEMENSIKYKNNRTDRIESRHSSQLSMQGKGSAQRSPLTIRDPTMLDPSMKSKSHASITSPMRNKSQKSQGEKSSPNMLKFSKQRSPTANFHRKVSKETGQWAVTLRATPGLKESAWDQLPRGNSTQNPYIESPATLGQKMVNRVRRENLELQEFEQPKSRDNILREKFINILKESKSKQRNNQTRSHDDQATHDRAYIRTHIEEVKAQREKLIQNLENSHSEAAKWKVVKNVAPVSKSFYIGSTPVEPDLTSQSIRKFEEQLQIREMNSTTSVLIPHLSEIQLQKEALNQISKTKTHESTSMPNSEKLKGVEPDKQVNIKEFLNKN